jgi:hypothetical protein
MRGLQFARLITAFLFLIFKFALLSAKIRISPLCIIKSNFDSLSCFLFFFFVSNGYLKLQFYHLMTYQLMANLKYTKGSGTDMCSRYQVTNLQKLKSYTFCYIIALHMAPLQHKRLS